MLNLNDSFWSDWRTTLCGGRASSTGGDGKRLFFYDGCCFFPTHLVRLLFLVSICKLSLSLT